MLDHETSFIAACKDFFGFKQDQGLAQFNEEMKQLTEKDRAEIKAGLVKIGYKIKA